MRAVRWQMQFMSKTGTLYTVRIFDDDYSGAITTLLPANEPFVTQEDDDDNAFVPVRYSTGYVRFIVEDLGVISDIMTTKVNGRYITLSETINGYIVVRWQGYMQTLSFQGPWEAAPHEIEFPIVSSLGVLDSMPYTPLREYMTLGYLFRRAITHDYMEFNTWNAPVRNSTPDFSAVINDDIFRQGDVEDWTVHVGYYADAAFPETKMTRLDVIREICKFFGWSLREDGPDLYFVAVKGTNSYQYGGISGLTQSSTAIVGNKTVSNVSITNIVSDNNNREFLPGYGYFEITENVDAPSNPVNFNLAQAAPADLTLYTNDMISYIKYGNISDGNIIATAESTGDFLTIFGERLYYGCMFVRVKIITDKNIRLAYYEARDEYKPSVAIKSGPDEKTATFTSSRNFVGRNYAGGLLLSGSIDYWSGNSWGDIPEGKQIKMKVQWGNKYLSRNSDFYMDYVWTDTASTFNVFIENGSLQDYYKRGSAIGPTFLTDGVHIPVENSLTGDITVTFYAVSTGDTTIEDAAIILSEIRLEALRPNEMNISANTDYSQNRFRATSNFGGSEVYSQSNLLCSGVDAAQECDELVLNNAKTAALDTLPEIDAVTRIANMYGEPTEQLTIDIAKTDIEPFDSLTVLGESYYYCASVEHRWRDDEMKLQLQKI